VLTANHGWIRIAEVNPPELPDMTHRELEATWSHVMVTDNVFGKIRMSPYAYAARITHDVPSVHPTVVVSTRDRNILAIESEVRGALVNGVDSFLVVNGDTLPQVDHLAHHYEVAQHLRRLQSRTGVPTFEVGMSSRFQRWQFRQRVERGAQFLVTGPVLDPATVEPNIAALARRDDDPPVYLMVTPPFTLKWVTQMELLGGVPATAALKNTLESTDQSARRDLAWTLLRETEDRARDSGCAGVILVGLKHDTVVEEAAREVRPLLEEGIVQ
jgi:5,10-methylenetetrahydrofolate reductase